MCIFIIVIVKIIVLVYGIIFNEVIFCIVVRQRKNVVYDIKYWFVVCICVG